MAAIDMQPRGWEADAPRKELERFLKHTSNEAHNTNHTSQGSDPQGYGSQYERKNAGQESTRAKHRVPRLKIRSALKFDHLKSTNRASTTSAVPCMNTYPCHLLAKPHTRDLFNNQDIVDLIAEQVEAKDLKAFRLVSQIFAQAGSRPLFRHLTLNTLANDMESVSRLETLSSTPQATLARSLEINKVYDFSIENDPPLLVLTSEPPITQDRLLKILKGFPKVDTVTLSGQTSVFRETLDTIHQSGLKIRNLELGGSIGSAPDGQVSLFMDLVRSPSVKSLLDIVTTLRLGNLDCYYWACVKNSEWFTVQDFAMKSIVWRRMSKGLASLIKAAHNLQHLEIGSWAHYWEFWNEPNHDVWGSWEFKTCSLQINVGGLRSLALSCVSATSEDLQQLLKSNQSTLTLLKLESISLAGGYWAPVLEEIASIVPRLVGLKLHYLNYPAKAQFGFYKDFNFPRCWKLRCFARTNFHEVARAGFDALCSNNPRDRAALMRIRSIGSHLVTTKIKKDWVGRPQSPMFTAMARCVGLTASGRRCYKRMFTYYSVSKGRWLHCTGGTGVEDVWLCRSHRHQTDRFQRWPYELGYSTGNQFR